MATRGLTKFSKSLGFEHPICSKLSGSTDHPPRGELLPLPNHDPFIAAIRERLCTIVERAPQRTLAELAFHLGVEPDRLRTLIDEADAPIDVAFLIDVVAAVVRAFGVDPQWLLTGRYDLSQHRHALALGEDPGGYQAVRDFVREQYQRLREGLSLFSWTLLKGR